ncbi:hypothetical protein EVAR_5847_1 [Eumeta japonica]|uniref:Uncharacterized protein n=1 Tax=Eumeta variegata TaxID=151549 RepID=A0A4C1TFC5_EUMVA|nr:hypothetical protein EVAR_5847_1 [Eumeta japonica]
MIPALLFCEPERRMRGKGTTVFQKPSLILFILRGRRSGGGRAPALLKLYSWPSRPTRINISSPLSIRVTSRPSDFIVERSESYLPLSRDRCRYDKASEGCAALANVAANKNNLPAQELSVRKFNNTKPSRPGQGWKEPKRRKSIGIRGYSFRAARRGAINAAGRRGQGRRTPVWATRISIADVPVRSRRRPTRPLTRLLHEY